MVPNQPSQKKHGEWTTKPYFHGWRMQASHRRYAMLLLWDWYKNIAMRMMVITSRVGAACWITSILLMNKICTIAPVDIRHIRLVVFEPSQTDAGFRPVWIDAMLVQIIFGCLYEYQFQLDPIPAKALDNFRFPKALRILWWWSCSGPFQWFFEEFSWNLQEQHDIWFEIHLQRLHSPKWNEYEYGKQIKTWVTPYLCATIIIKQSHSKFKIFIKYVYESWSKYVVQYHLYFVFGKGSFAQPALPGFFMQITGGH